MRKVLLSLFLLAFLMLTACRSSEPSFVTVKDNSFYIDNEKYNFLGTNMWYGPLLGMAKTPGDRERLVKELDFLKSIGVTNLRIMGASEKTEYDNTVTPAFQTAPGIYNEDVLVGLDFCLAEMAKRDMKAVIYLGNNWIWTGGFAQLVAWANDEVNPNPFLPQYEWHNFMNFSARLYSDEKAQKLYFDYVKMLVNRKNTITGKLYKNDPAIMSWQLANEPRPGEGEEGRENFDVFLKWVKKSSALIKSVDKNHLVSTGNEGLAGTIGSEETFKTMYEFETIDYVTAHLWIFNWGWFDPLRAEETYSQAIKLADEYLEKHIEMSAGLGKPLVIEEFGIPRDSHSYSPNATTVYRDKYYKMLFSKIYENAKVGGPMAGSNFWAFGGFGEPSNPDGESKWFTGDDFTGDPPQEPQGRNAVFATDNSTIFLLKKYAASMQKLK